jgi:hypothetical protein
LNLNQKAASGKLGAAFFMSFRVLSFREEPQAQSCVLRRDFIATLVSLHEGFRHSI